MVSIWQDVKKFLAEGFDIVRMIQCSLSEKPHAWDWSIAKFGAQDRLRPPPPGVIVFTGSSSITFWGTLEQDMAPLPVINRGFGGSKIHQVVHYADRIVIPYHPRAVVLFAGTNDIAGSKPKTARQVFDGYLAFVKAITVRCPKRPSITFRSRRHLPAGNDGRLSAKRIASSKPIQQQTHGCISLI